MFYRIFKNVFSIALVFSLFIPFSACEDKIEGTDDNDTIDDGIVTGTPTIAGTYTWGNVAIGGGGFTTGIITCPTEENLIYLRTDVGGAYKWIESTASWKPITDFVGPDETSLLGIESIAVDPQNPENVYIAAGTSYWNDGLSCILISKDYGESFTQVDVTSQFTFHGNGMGRQTGERLAVDPNKSNILFCGTRWNGLWKSTDSGNTWSQVSSFPVTTTSNDNGLCFVQFDESSSTTGTATQTIYVGVSKLGSTNLYVSYDGGSSWEGVPGASTKYMPMRCLLADSNLYVAYADAEGPWNPSTGFLLKFDISSQEWTDISPESDTPYNGITTNSDHTVLIASTCNKWVDQEVAWGDEIYRSTDGGESWTKLFQDGVASVNEGNIAWLSSGSIHWAGDVKIDPFNADRAFIISGNGVFISENINSDVVEWTCTSEGVEETVPYDVVSLPDDGNGNTWLLSVIADYDGYQHVDMSTYPAKRHYPNIGSETGIDCAYQKPNFVVRVGGSSGSNAMYYSEDYGETWSKVKTNSVDKYGGNIAVSADGECIVWSPGSSSTLYWTDDLGATWSECENISGSLDPVADPANPDYFYAYSTSGYFYKSTDKGKTFTSKTTSFSGGNTLIRTIPADTIGGHILFPAGGDGLYLSQTFGITFTQLESVTYCEAVGTGVGPEGSDYPSIFIYGKTTDDATLGAYRSDDIGETWVRVNDDEHQFGGLANGEFIMGDNNVFGRVYMSTAGRGIVYGDID